MGKVFSSQPVAGSATQSTDHFRGKYGWRLLLASIYLVSLFIQTRSVRANSYNVACDANNLIGAIVAANATSADDTINLAVGCTYILTIVNNNTVGPNGLPVIADAATAGKLTIQGNGATITRSTAAGTPDFRIFLIASGGNLTLDSLSVKNGNLPADVGGCINSFGTLMLINTSIMDNAATYGGGIADNGSSLTVTDSSFIGNTTVHDGAGINSAGTLVVSGSTFSGNIAQGLASGIIIHNGGTATVTNTTFSGNSAFEAAGGAGMMVVLADAAVTGCTFSGNYAEGAGGGLFVGGTGASVVVDNSTFFNNSATNGGGIWNTLATLTVANSTFYGNSALGEGGGIGIESGTVNLGSTIVSGDTSVNLGPDIARSVNSLGYNLIGSSAGATITGSTSGNLTDAAAVPLNLGPLHNNGGPTQTMALLPGSVAINTGTNAGCPATDQRGVARPQGATCDMGAFELDTTAPTVTSITRLNPSPTNLASVNFTVTFSEPVTGVDGSDFNLTTTGISGASVTGASGGPSLYTVSVDTGGGNGTLRLDVPASASITDLALKPLAGLPYTSGETIPLPKRSPYSCQSFCADTPTWNLPGQACHIHRIAR